MCKTIALPTELSPNEHKKGGAGVEPARRGHEPFVLPLHQPMAKFVAARGFEPRTLGSKGQYSTIELRNQKQKYKL